MADGFDAGGIFLTDSEWDKCRTSKEFEYVVIGSSFCALGFIHQLLEKNPNSKILIIERGEYKDFQSLSPKELSQKSKDKEEYDWVVSKKTKEGEHICCVRGMNNFFGGRSSFWKAWSPKPISEEMTGWPDEVIESVHKYFPHAKELLNVKPVNEIKVKGRNLFGQLQETVYQRLKSACSQVNYITRVEHAPIAVNSYSDDDFCKYSAVKPLLDIVQQHDNVKAVLKCEVQKINNDGVKAVSLETTRNTFTLGHAKLVLAMSTLPSTTLMLNSFHLHSHDHPLNNIGERFTGHFVTYIFARVPFDQIMYGFLQQQTPDCLEMAALYIAGKHGESKHQFHIQLTAIAVTNPPLEDKKYDCMRHLLKAPSEKQISTSGNHVVFVCAILGQLDHENEDNWYRHLNRDETVTQKATLQVVANQNDKELWKFMDDTAFQILKEYLAPGPDNSIEYWHNQSERWMTDHPPIDQIRANGLVHPASTMWIGSPETSPVNYDYRFHGITNVYLTGGALWPTGASWNPTCTMTAMAMNLADIVSSKTDSVYPCCICGIL